MPLANTDLMLQTATYWGPPTPDVYSEGTYPAPVQISCRWEDRADLFVDRDGQERQSAAVVYPDQELSTDGWLVLGTSAESDPHDAEGAFQIKATRNIPSLDNTLYELKVWL